MHERLVFINARIVLLGGNVCHIKARNIQEQKKQSSSNACTVQELNAP